MLEVLLAMGLLVLVSAMTYWFYFSALRTRERDTQVSERIHLVRVVLQRIANEIRQSAVLATDQVVGIQGDAERIRLSSIRVPAKGELPTPSSFEEPPVEYDLTQVEYRIARHPDVLNEDGYPEALGLARVERRIPRPIHVDFDEEFGDEELPLPPPDPEDAASGETVIEDKGEGEPSIGTADEIRWEELYAKPIRFLRFCYFDGYRWWDDWDVIGENPLPQLVQVTIGFDSHPPFDAEFGVREKEAEEFCTCMNREPMDCLPLPPDQFSITVRIPQADPFFRSRIGREVKSILEEVPKEGEEEEEGKEQPEETAE
jgi:hypothetical protein